MQISFGWATAWAYCEMPQIEAQRQSLWKTQACCAGAWAEKSFLNHLLPSQHLENSWLDTSLNWCWQAYLFLKRFLNVSRPPALCWEKNFTFSAECRCLLCWQPFHLNTLFSAALSYFNLPDEVWVFNPCLLVKYQEETEHCHRLLFCSNMQISDMCCRQQSPIFLAQRPGSWKTMFPWTRVEEGSLGKIQARYIYCTLFVLLLHPAPPQIIRR